MSIALHASTEKTIKAWAKQQDIKSAPDAAEKLVNTAISRKAALAKYAKKQSKGGGEKGAKKGAKKGGKAKK